MDKKRLVIIDGKSIFYRGYYAMPDLTTKDGQTVGGVYGFTVLVLEVIKKFQPDYICIAWDKSKTNIRSRLKIYDQYKSNRQTPPADFLSQIPILFDLVKSFNWPIYELDDYEADDIMASLAFKAQKKNLETILVSSDLDLLQALSDETMIYILKRGLSHIEKFNISEFETKYGIRVDQFIDFKSLMGDSSDNIPGAKGIGAKGAAKLLNQFESLDDIYDNLDQIDEKLRQKLIDSKEMVFISRELVTLFVDAPAELDLKKMDINNLDPKELQSKLLQLEFFSLINKIPIEALKRNNLSSIQQANQIIKKPKVIKHEDIKEIEQLNLSKPIFFHTYCRGRFGRKPLYVIASDNKSTIHIYSVKRAPNLKIKQLKIWGYKTKQALQVLLDWGLKDIVVEHDVHVASFLLDSNRHKQNLTDLAFQKLNYVSEIDSLPSEDFLEKASEIAAIISLIRDNQKKELTTNPKIQKLALDIEYPLINVLAQLEKYGMNLDLSILKHLGKVLDDKIKEFIDLIYKHAGMEFNISSPNQLASVMYGKLKLPTQGIRKVDGRPSTDAEQLTKLQDKHPIIRCLQGYREYTKIKNTYVKGLVSRIEPDGRVRSDLNQTVAETGRLSSSNPNLQNIPIRSDIGRLVRKAFTAPPGKKLVSADYNQFELRLAAVLSGDKDMMKAFNDGVDIHNLTASQIFEVALDKVSKVQRSTAKNINFGVLYGQGPHSLALQSGMTFKEAKDFIEKYFKQRPALKSYLDGVKEDARRQGYAETLFGRRRYIPQLKSSSNVHRQAGLRQAINMPIQGTEADLMKMAMVELDRLLDDDCWQVMQVHDSIVVECPTGKAEKTSQIMKDTMENVYPELGIKLSVDIGIGNDWFEI